MRPCLADAIKAQAGRPAEDTQSGWRIKALAPLPGPADARRRGEGGGGERRWKEEEEEGEA